MLAPGTEYARQTLDAARELRDAIASHPRSEPSAPAVLQTLSRLIDLSEALLAEREQYESRLQRSRCVDAHLDGPASAHHS